MLGAAILSACAGRRALPAAGEGEEGPRLGESVAVPPRRRGGGAPSPGAGGLEGLAGVAAGPGRAGEALPGERAHPHRLEHGAGPGAPVPGAAGLRARLPAEVPRWRRSGGLGDIALAVVFGGNSVSAAPEGTGLESVPFLLEPLGLSECSAAGTLWAHGACWPRVAFSQKEGRP